MQPEVTELSDEERDLYLKLQAKVGWKRTGTEVFESFFPILPFVPSEQALVRTCADGSKEVLMWYREDPHYKGWHMVGGYILHGESDEEWLARCIKKETDLKLSSFWHIRDFNTRPETGWVPNHQMARFFVCEVKGEPSVGTWFPLNAIPEDTLGHHKKYIDCLRAHFMRMETMCQKGIWHDHKSKAPQWKWRVCNWNYFGESADRVDSGRVYDALDDAVAAFRSFEAPLAYLVDDQGLQIL